jgi:hypothetical protein
MGVELALFQKAIAAAHEDIGRLRESVYQNPKDRRTRYAGSSFSARVATTLLIAANGTLSASNATRPVRRQIEVVRHRECHLTATRCPRRLP